MKKTTLLCTLIAIALSSGAFAQGKAPAKNEVKPNFRSANATGKANKENKGAPCCLGQKKVVKVLGSNQKNLAAPATTVK